ncbi:four helix bundle protein [Kaistella montana]|uniref:Four helix bundle protein n=1 Tax=Kaistella montana TaxID=1849733 RepID=A0ABW5KA37_9FLAO|nr:four helix bundle protein [Kaistella montana]MCQ4035394.1 four helix bundle protein [Kaistella montana]
MKDFRQLQVWSKAHHLVKEIYLITESFPKEEIYGVTSQLRRASVSIPTNIAEGCGRGSDADFKRFIQMSFGSASEVEYLVFLSFELSFITESNYVILNPQIVEIKKMLARLINKLK